MPMYLCIRIHAPCHTSIYYWPMYQVISNDLGSHTYFLVLQALVSRHVRSDNVEVVSSAQMQGSFSQIMTHPSIQYRSFGMLKTWPIVWEWTPLFFSSMPKDFESSASTFQTVRTLPTKDSSQCCSPGTWTYSRFQSNGVTARISSANGW